MKLNSTACWSGLGALILAAATTVARAQSGGQFDLSWSTINGGGGTSSGGQFALSGSIGQPDTGALNGGHFKLEGGFWSGIALVQTLDAPVLKITFSGGMATLSWPVGATGFMLEETAYASQANSWIATPGSVVDTATEHTVTVPAAGPIRCYRLRKP